MEQQHPTFANGKICYLMIPAIDISTSVSFYQNVFNWNIRAHKDGSLSFDDGAGEVSGTWVTGKKPLTEGSLVVHIMVDDIHASMDLVVTNGGQIVQPIGIDAPEVTCHFTDPAGNVFGLFQQ